MRHDSRYETLDTLDDYQLVHSSQDIRGFPLVDAQGGKLGVIADLLVGEDHDEVAAVRLEDGRCIAVEPLEIHDNVVVYGENAKAHAMAGGAAVVEEERIPVVEERVAIGKRVAEHGKNIKVRTRVVNDTVSEDVKLRDETVSIERTPVDRKVSAADAEALLKDSSVTMTESAEELVVAKEAVVTDEVVVKKTAGDHVEHVEETVRKTKVDVNGNGNGR